MLTFYKGHYSKKQLSMLKILMRDALGNLKDYYCEEDVRYNEHGVLTNYSQKSCEGCPYKTLCKDLSRLINHLEENHAE